MKLNCIFFKCVSLLSQFYGPENRRSKEDAHTHIYTHTYPFLILLKTSNLFLPQHIYAFIEMVSGEANFHGRSLLTHLQLQVVAIVTPVLSKIRDTITAIQKFSPKCEHISPFVGKLQGFSGFPLPNELQGKLKILINIREVVWGGCQRESRRSLSWACTSVLLLYLL